VFLFLLNSSGAVILFVYLLIALSQIVLRRRTDSSTLTVKMWLFPVLSVVVVVAILAVLAQMAFDPEVRPQLVLSLLSWALVIALYFISRKIMGRAPAERPAENVPTGPASRVLVLANETVEGPELLDELRAIDAEHRATYFVCVPANPIDTGQAMHEGAAFVWDATTVAAQRRLDRTLEILRGEGLEADGALGNYRPLRALAEAVESFRPDRLVICTLPEDQSAWLRFDVVERAREQHHLPVTHVVVQPLAAVGAR
jgi:GABA permease